MGVVRESLSRSAADSRAPVQGDVNEVVGRHSCSDAESSPVPGAVVYVGYDPSMEGGRRPAGLAHGNMVADQDGTFHIQGLVPDTPIALQAELNGRLSDVVTISSIDPGFERSGIVLRMQ